MNTPLTAGNHLRTLSVDGRERSYLIHVPPNHDPQRPTAVVLALHGATSNANLMQKFCGLDHKADEAGFLVVYPNGTGNVSTVLTWNGGICCGYAMKNQVDDVAFLRTLLDDLGTITALDPRRFFAAGMSNGAMMAYRLAAECADRIAAIAAVAGPMGIENPQPSRPVPVLHIHGTDDEFSPYLGGRGERSVYGVVSPSAPDSVAAWVRVNGCQETPILVAETPLVDDGTRIVRRTYPHGKKGSVVVFITVEGGGHTWPGRPPFPLILGKSTANLSANDVIWDFFCQHPLMK